MKKNITLKLNNLSIKNEKNLQEEPKPKQSTIDFLMAYSRVLHVEKLKDGKTVELMLN